MWGSLEQSISKELLYQPSIDICLLVQLWTPLNSIMQITNMFFFFLSWVTILNISPFLDTRSLQDSFKYNPYFGLVFKFFFFLSIFAFVCIINLLNKFHLKKVYVWHLNWMLHVLDSSFSFLFSFHFFVYLYSGAILRIHERKIVSYSSLM